MKRISVMVLLYNLPFIHIHIVAQPDVEETTTTPSPTTTLQTVQAAPDVEILKIYVLPGVGNSIRVVWGGGGAQSTNLTYGVYFGGDEAELEYPKITTSNSSATIDDLEFCTKYSFAVVIQDGAAFETVKVNPNTVRTVITGIDNVAPPVNLTVDLEPKMHPCLDIKWSAACPNVVEPIGYVLSIYDKQESKNKVITIPKTKRSDLIYRLPVEYGDSYDFLVSTSFPGSKAIGPLSFTVPQPLQPFKVKVTVNKEDGAFLIYWTEPFVPLSIGRYYYQVFVYPGQDIEAPYEKYYVTRPVIVYKGERGEYTFCINLASYDRKHVSGVTALIYANLNGESYELNMTLPEIPD